MPGSGRRRQAAAPLRRRLRLDLLLWGVLAGGFAGIVLGLTGGGWGRAGVLALLVVVGFAVLTALSSTSARRRPPPRPDRPASPEAPDDRTDP